MNGNPASSNRASAAEIFAICIKEIAPSCMRAPPEAEKIISDERVSIARSIARAIFSPTTAPSEPPTNDSSIAHTIEGWPPTLPSAVISASSKPVFFCILPSRSR